RHRLVRVGRVTRDRLQVRLGERPRAAAGHVAGQRALTLVQQVDRLLAVDRQAERAPHALVPPGGAPAEVDRAEAVGVQALRRDLVLQHGLQRCDVRLRQLRREVVLARLERGDARAGVRDDERRYTGQVRLALYEVGGVRLVGEAVAAYVLLQLEGA